MSPLSRFLIVLCAGLMLAVVVLIFQRPVINDAMVEKFAKASWEESMRTVPRMEDMPGKPPRPQWNAIDPDVKARLLHVIAVGLRAVL